MKHKVLSVKQPWAYLLCARVKDIENRTWKLPEKYKGERILIHASAAKMKSLQKMLTLEQKAIVDKKLGYEYDWDKVFAKSAIIGSVRFVDCVINHPSIWAEKEVLEDWTSKDIPGKYSKSVYNWVVADPILFDKPILNVKGKLGFWDYDLPEEYETELTKHWDYDTGRISKTRSIQTG